MGWLDFAINNEEPYYQEEKRSIGTGESLESLLSNHKYMTEDMALSIPTVQACVNLICGTIAQGPIHLYKKDEKGTQIRIVGDRREFLLNEEPNEFINGFTLKYNWAKDYLLNGDSYTFIDGDDVSNVKGLHYIKNDAVFVEKYKKRGLITNAYINIASEDGVFRNRPMDFIIILNDSVDGLEGKGILEKGLDTLILAKNEQQYSQSVYENGALPLGVLKTDRRLSDDSLTRLQDNWKNLYQGLKNSNKTVILEEGLDYKPMSLKPSDLQLDSSRSHVLSEICRLLNVPESLINSDAGKYGNIEQNNIHFLQYCISPIFEAIEKALNKAFLLESEKEEGYFWAIDDTNVLRTTFADKVNALKTAVDGGLLSINEARSELNKQKLGKDLMRFSLGNVFYDKDTTDMIIPNMGGIINIDDKKFEKLGDDGNGIQPNSIIKENAEAEDSKKPGEDKESSK